MYAYCFSLSIHLMTFPLILMIHLCKICNINSSYLKMKLIYNLINFVSLDFIFERIWTARPKSANFISAASKLVSLKSRFPNFISLLKQ